MSRAILPVACSLTEPELQQRREKILGEVGKYLTGSNELPNGFRFDFPANDELLEKITQLINLERKCCPFLNFSLKIEAQKETCALELTGPEGTKEAIDMLFEWNIKKT